MVFINIINFLNELRHFQEFIYIKKWFKKTTCHVLGQL
jgi:hypothetical protein